MMGIFKGKAMPHQLRCINILNLPKVKSTHDGTDTVRFFVGQTIWEKLPTEIKNSATLELSKNNWNPQWNCRICKTFIHGQGLF